MYQSDSDSKDSDEGIRFKTQSIRNKVNPLPSKRSYRDKSRSRSPSRSRRRSKTDRRRRRSSSEEDRKRRKSPLFEADRRRRRSALDENDRRRKRSSSHDRSERYRALSHEKNNRSRRTSPEVTTRRRKSSSPEQKRSLEEINQVVLPHLKTNSKVVCEEVTVIAANESAPLTGKNVEETRDCTCIVEETLQQVEAIGPREISPTQSCSDEKVIGPGLPPRFQPQEEEPNEMMGPMLPPHLRDREDDSPGVGIGPWLPPHLRQKLQDESTTSTDALADDDVYGPLPAHDVKYSKAQLALEERALELKINQLEPSETKEKGRAEWMVELPEVKASKFGLGPRQFRSKAGPDMSDRSSWTDTPDTKAKPKNEKIDLKTETELRETRQRDEQQERMLMKHKRKNKESLLEMHEIKMKKKQQQKEGSESSERRPFSREIDLQVNRFDEAQKKAVLKKAQLLDNRFSSGQSKFL